MQKGKPTSFLVVIFFSRRGNLVWKILLSFWFAHMDHVEDSNHKSNSFKGQIHLKVPKLLIPQKCFCAVEATSVIVVLKGVQKTWSTQSNPLG